jgi:hypothetical protein
MSANLWAGQIVSDDQFKNEIKKHFENSLFWAKPPLSHYVLFDVVKKMQEELKAEGILYKALLKDLESREDITKDEVKASMDGLIDFLSVDQLRIKLKRELGNHVKTSKFTKIINILQFNVYFCLIILKDNHHIDFFSSVEPPLQVFYRLSNHFYRQSLPDMQFSIPDVFQLLQQRKRLQKGNQDGSQSDARR